MSRPTHVRCSFPGVSPVRIYGVYATAKDAREVGPESPVGTGYVMDLVYPEGSRVPVQGDVLDVTKPQGGRAYGSVVAPKEAA